MDGGYRTGALVNKDSKFPIPVENRDTENNENASTKEK
jgi:hypothetical protein